MENVFTPKKLKDLYENIVLENFDNLKLNIYENIVFYDKIKTKPIPNYNTFRKNFKDSAYKDIIFTNNKSWIFSQSSKIKLENIQLRFYINPAAEDLEKFFTVYNTQAILAKIPFSAKVANKTVPDRADNIVIYTDKKHFMANYKILKNIQKNHPEMVSRCRKTSILTKSITGLSFATYGEEPLTPKTSYNYMMSGFLGSEFTKVTNKFIVRNQKEFVSIFEKAIEIWEPTQSEQQKELDDWKSVLSKYSHIPLVGKTTKEKVKFIQTKKLDLFLQDINEFINSNLTSKEFAQKKGYAETMESYGHTLSTNFKINNLFSNKVVLFLLKNSFIKLYNQNENKQEMYKGLSVAINKNFDKLMRGKVFNPIDVNKMIDNGYSKV